MTLIAEYTRLKAGHHAALRMRAARVTLGSSVIRVFKPDTKPKLLRVLADLCIDDLPTRSENTFRSWFEQHLDAVAKCINEKNSENERIKPGAKWGHATKVLTIYLREIVSQTRYFKDPEAERIEHLLYVPIDSVTIENLVRLNHRPKFKLIKEIETARMFYEVQNLLGEAAREAGVPRVWFDDNWGDREAGL